MSATFAMAEGTTAFEELPTAPAGVIQFTAEAVNKVREMRERLPSQDLFLRLGVKGGGCSGFSYVLEFDGDADPRFDRRVELTDAPELKVVTDRKSLLFLAGTTLHYTGDLHFLGEGGFEFRNPTASKTCGCGTSFQA